MSGYIGNIPVPQATQTRDTFTATAGQTTFATSGYTPSFLDVFLNGVHLVNGTDYTASNGSDVVLTSGAAAGDTLEVVAYSTFQLADQTFTGDFSVDSPTFVVDSTNNRAGIGTTSPQKALDVRGELAISNSTTSYWNLNRDDTDGSLTFTDTNVSERMRIDTSGNVGIGNTSSGYVFTSGETRLAVGDGSEHAAIQIYSGTTKWGGLEFADDATNGTGQGRVAYYHPNDYMQFDTNGAERMRITSTGQVLIGRTATSGVADGHRFDANGFTQHVRDDGNPLELVRETSDGKIVVLKKDTSIVGSIGVDASRPFIASSDTGIRFAGLDIMPCNGNGTPVDNQKDVGSSIYRWDDIYATNGTIQTSDQNEKQQIATLTDAEIAAAKAISKLFKTFKWNDSVAEKGDTARTHTGVIAQEVEQAMTDAGLNAGDYAFFISTTWWETQTEVPAVEADEENGIEAQEAYTRTDTYDAAEEAPEGATERTRKGIRYPQLLSFIGAATEQRLASVEDRLDALENPA